jgi:NodT family efflux transporter outer membrane factor (OMF) lipoprotein
MNNQIFFILISIVVLGGCTVGPKYKPPDMNMPCEWHSPLSEGMHEAASDSFIWWESFNDPVLNCLIQRAASQNLDLRIAATRILQARSEKKGKTSDLYPHIDFSANYDHLYYSKDALVNGLFVNPHRIKRNVNFFELGFDADWEIDLFGLTAHELKALNAKEEASEENLRAIWITLSAEVARSYIELRGLQERLIIFEKNLSAQENIVKSNQDLVNRGIINEADLRHSESQFKTLAAQKPLMELAVSRSIHRLSILLGHAPGDLFDELITSCTFPELPNDKPIGVPSELLRRRADIRKAERELAAATEKVGSAIASLFPRFSLRGFIGDISTQAGSLFKPSSATWLAGPQVLLPIFNSKLILQDVEYNKILTRQALYEYQKAVLEALKEVENSIASYHFQLEHHHLLSEACEADKEAFDLLEQLYQLGIKDNRDLLASRRTLIIAEDACLQSRIDLLLHYISLYKALGGCWE